MLTARYNPNEEDPTGVPLETSVSFEVTEGITLVERRREIEAGRKP